MPAPVARRRTVLRGLARQRAAQGRFLPGDTPADLPARSIDWLPTLLEKGRAPLRREHLRWREPRLPPLRRIFFLLDCSASMVGSGALARAKGWLAGWTQPLRREGAHVALVCFGGGRAEVRFGPAPLPVREARDREAGAGAGRGRGKERGEKQSHESDHEHGHRQGPPPPHARDSEWNDPWRTAWIEPIGGGGGTPLALGLAKLTQLRAMRMPRDMANTRFRDVLVLLSDGRTAERPPAPAGFERVIVVDFESHRIALNRCADIAMQWDAEWVLGSAPHI